MSTFATVGNACLTRFSPLAKPQPLRDLLAPVGASLCNGLADLPAGGKRLLQKAEGYVATIKSGKVTFREGVATGERPGTLIRGPQSAPLAMAAE